jgi:hypothetical protein
MSALTQKLKKEICDVLKEFTLDSGECVSEIMIGPFTDDGNYQIRVTLESGEVITDET